MALKLIHPSLVDTDARQRMIDEGVLARKVSSPNVVRVHDVGERDGQIYLVMEVVEGEPLRAYMARNLVSQSGAPLGEVVAIVRAILAGVAAAHAQDLVHRDIKPENIMISGTPGAADFRLKVLDFGIARGLKTSAFTGSGAIGTPLYMAPEQKTMPAAVGPAADLYSVGRIFYELLLDVPPEGTWSPPSEQRTDVPPALDEVLRKSQIASPRHRYQTVAEFSDALDAALGGTAPARPGRPAASPSLSTRVITGGGGRGVHAAIGGRVARRDPQGRRPRSQVQSRPRAAPQARHEGGRAHVGMSTGKIILWVAIVGVFAVVVFLYG